MLRTRITPTLRKKDKPAPPSPADSLGKPPLRMQFKWSEPLRWARHKIRWVVLAHPVAAARMARTHRAHLEMQASQDNRAPARREIRAAVHSAADLAAARAAADLAGEAEAVAGQASGALSAGLRESTLLWVRSASCASASTACITASTIPLEIQH